MSARKIHDRVPCDRLLSRASIWGGGGGRKAARCRSSCSTREKEGAVREDTVRKGRESEDAAGPVILYVSMLVTTSHPGCGWRTEGGLLKKKWSGMLENCKGWNWKVVGPGVELNRIPKVYN